MRPLSALTACPSPSRCSQWGSTVLGSSLPCYLSHSNSLVLEPTPIGIYSGLLDFRLSRSLRPSRLLKANVIPQGDFLDHFISLTAMHAEVTGSSLGNPFGWLWPCHAIFWCSPCLVGSSQYLRPLAGGLCSQHSTMEVPGPGLVLPSSTCTLLLLVF